MQVIIVLRLSMGLYYSTKCVMYYSSTEAARDQHVDISHNFAQLKTDAPGWWQVTLPCCMYTVPINWAPSQTIVWPTAGDQSESSHSGCNTCDLCEQSIMTILCELFHDHNIIYIIMSELSMQYYIHRRPFCALYDRYVYTIIATTNNYTQSFSATSSGKSRR